MTLSMCGWTEGVFGKISAAGTSLSVLKIGAGTSMMFKTERQAPVPQVLEV